jgi:16S rRNA (guanine966-N2)-methyltransferase
MRITGGILRGRQVKVPKSGVRPTQDKVRAALFSILGARVPGCRFLDLFAGSGAVGLEAWSRGAEWVCWVEDDRRVQQVLDANVHQLCDSHTTVFGMDAERFLKKRLVEPGFDIIFCDPPYDKLGKRGTLDQILRAVQESDRLLPRGIFIMEQNAEEGPGMHENWELIDDRVYGQSRLRFFQRLTSQIENERSSI